MEINILNDIIKIEKESFNVPWDLDYYKSMDGNSDYKIIYRACGSKAAGYMVLLFLPDIIEIIKIAVDKEMRGLGIAGEMIREAQEAADNKGCALWLEVRESNVPARNLYRKHGFSEIAVRKRYYGDNGENAVVMKYEKK